MYVAWDVFVFVSGADLENAHLTLLSLNVDCDGQSGAGILGVVFAGFLLSGLALWIL